MSGADSIDFSGQIRKVCPAGAIGFRLTDTRTSPSTTYPIKATPRDYYLITDEVVEFPSAAPPGSYRVQFIIKWQDYNPRKGDQGSCGR